MSNTVTHSALAFQPPTLLLDRYVALYGVSLNEAREGFEETKKFLALCASRPNERLSPSKSIDNYWHEWIIFTKSYAQFCSLVGTFVHHDPSAAPEVDAYYKTVREMKKFYGDVDSKYWSNNIDAGKCCSTCGSPCH
jgi:hypothetical protein